MKNILVILNAGVSQQHVAEVAIHIAKRSSSGLHVVFLDPIPDEVDYDYFFINDLSIAQQTEGLPAMDESVKAMAALNRKLFEDMCATSEVPYVIEPAASVSMNWLIEQTAFADLVITGAGERIEQFQTVDLLSESKCPVYLVSKNVVDPRQVLLTYDGSYASIYAMKQYALVFPELKDLPVSLLYISSDDNDEFPREKNIRSWLPAHFSNVAFTLLKGDVREELVNYVTSMPESLVVMGSFGRSQFSKLFHKSIANALISEGKATLFISHK
jgi:nucleotide-binding universal stress UspA family protein